jgi:hypothetical protein
MPVKEKLASASLLRKLEHNRNRRGIAVVEFEAARAELTKLLREGRGKVAVTKMCAAAGISRQRAYDLLNGVERRPRGQYNDEGGN